MNLFDKYFPADSKIDDNVNNSNQVNMKELTEVIKLQIDNAMKVAVEELKNNIKENENYDNNSESKQGINKEGEVSIDTESGNTDHQ